MFFGIIAGLVSGIISGMGIGGGAILIPALTLVGGVAQRTAQGINLTYFLPTAVAALVVHIKKGRVELKCAAPLALSGAAGAYLGSRIATATDGGVLGKCFGVFLLAAGIYEIFKGIKS